MGVSLTIKNKTADYVFYDQVQHNLETIPNAVLDIPSTDQIIPNDELDVTLTDLENLVLLTFDRCENPTPWRTFGLGRGLLRCSFDPASRQSQISVIMSPAPAGPQETTAPTFEVSGDITGAGQDNWTKGLEFILQGSNVSQITLSITE